MALPGSHIFRPAALALLIASGLGAPQATNAAKASPSRATGQATPPRFDARNSFLKVFTSVDGAVVYLNGKYAGRTPLEARIPRGQYRIQVFRYGYRPVTDDFHNGALNQLVLSYPLLALPSDLKISTVAGINLTNAVLSNRESGLRLDLSFLENLGNGRWRASLKAGTWDLAFGAFGKRNLLTNAVLSPGADTDLDLTFVDAVKRWTPVAWIGKPGSGAGELNLPQGITLSGDTLAVADAGNARIQLFRTDGTFLKSVTLPGDQAFAFPTSIAFRPEPAVTDSRKNRIVYFTPDWSFDTATSPSESLRLPQGLSAQSGKVAVADSGNGQIRLFRGETASTNFDKLGLANPVDVKFTSSGDLLISDWGNQRLVLANDRGESKAEVALGFSPGFPAIDDAGVIFVPDPAGNRVLLYDRNLGYSNTVILSNAGAPWGAAWGGKRLYLSARDGGQVIVLEEK